MSNEKLRVPLNHLNPQKTPSIISTVKNARQNLLDFLGEGNIVNYVITEKIDGMLLGLGWDEFGFFMQTSSSGRYRSAVEVEHQHILGFDPPSDTYATDTLKYHFLTLADIFRTFSRHNTLLNLLKYVFDNTKKETVIRGELLWKDFGRINSQGCFVFVGTPYSRYALGRKGTFVVHTECHDRFLKNMITTNLLSLDNEEIKIDWDHVGNISMCINKYKDKINNTSERIPDRRHPDWLVLEDVANELYQKFRKSLPERGEFGPWPEGYVVHGPNNTKYKIIHPNWKNEELLK